MKKRDPQNQRRRQAFRKVKLALIDSFIQGKFVFGVWEEDTYTGRRSEDVPPDKRRYTSIHISSNSKYISADHKMIWQRERTHSPSFNQQLSQDEALEIVRKATLGAEEW